MKLKSLMNKVDVYKKVSSIVRVVLKKLRLRHSRFRAKSFCLFNKALAFRTPLVYLFNKSLSLVGKFLVLKLKKVLVGLVCCGVLLVVSYGFGYVVDNDGAENVGFPFRTGMPLPNARMQISVTTGNMWLEQMDYQTAGLGGELNLGRFYNSRVQTDGLFGKGWQTKFEMSLREYGDLMLRLKMADGRAVYLGRKDAKSAYTFSPQRHFISSVTKQTDGSYLLKLKDGRDYKFTSSGRLEWREDKDGNRTKLKYDVNGNLTKVTDAFGRSLTFTMSSGRVTRVSDAFGTVADYAYNADGTLQSVAYVGNLKYKFEYVSVNDKKYMATVKDVSNNILEAYQYDKQGRVTMSEKYGGYGGGEKLTIDYEGHSNYQNNPYTIVTDALGRVTRYNFKEAANGLKEILSIEGNCDCESREEKIPYEDDDRLGIIKENGRIGR